MDSPAGHLAGHSLFGAFADAEHEQRDQGSTTHFYPNAQFQFVGDGQGKEEMMDLGDGVVVPRAAVEPPQAQQKQSQQPVRRFDLILDRKTRHAKYHRHRSLPFKKIGDMDDYCDTYTLMIQLNEDFDECLYLGPVELVDQFMSEEGIRISNLDEVVLKMKGNYTSRSLTLTERERSKAYRSRRESLMVRMQEMDGVYGCQSFMVTVRLDNGSAYFSGHPVMVTKFFGGGVSRRDFGRSINVRPFELDETEHASCAVTFCNVTRPTLPRWRQAAMDYFRWPEALPLTLHSAKTFVQRAKWAAELDLDPNNIPSKMWVCSLHFRDGRPTDDSPMPSVLLKDPSLDEESLGCLVFGGKRIKAEDIVNASKGVANAKSKTADCYQNQPITRFVKLVLTNKRRRRRFKRKKAKVKQLAKTSRTHQCARHIFNRALHWRLGTVIRCSRSGKRFVNQRSFYRHFLENYAKSSKPKSDDEDEKVTASTDEDEDDEKLIIDLDAFSKKGKKRAAAKKQTPTPKMAPLSVNVSPAETTCALRSFYPSCTTKTMNPRKKYVCAVCKSVCDLFGLFVHMKEVHKGILCQYCLKLFKKVGDLELHLKKVHKVTPRYYHSAKHFEEYAGRDYRFICSECNELVDFASLDRHDCCNKPLLPAKRRDRGGQKHVKLSLDCPFCERRFLSRPQLEAHLCDGSCQGMNFDSRPASLEDIAKLYKVLTGLDFDPSIADQPADNSGDYGSDEQAKENQAAASVKTYNRLVLSDKNFVDQYETDRDDDWKDEKTQPVAEALPRSGNLYYPTLRVVNNLVKKEMRESGQLVDLVGLLSDAGVQDLDDAGRRAKGEDKGSSSPSPSLRRVLAELEVTQSGRNFILRNPRKEREAQEERRRAAAEAEEQRRQKMLEIERRRQQQQQQQPRDLEEDLPRIPVLTIRTPQPQTPSAAAANNKLVLKVPTPSVGGGAQSVVDPLGSEPPPKRRKESKKQRRTRVANEIYDNMVRIKDVLDAYRENCLFCQQTCFVSVDTVFLLNHINAAHDQEEVRAMLGEDPQHCIDRIKRHLKDVRIRDSIFTYDVADEFRFSGYRRYRCCYCSGKVYQDYADLFAHVDAEHKTHVLTCHLCSNIFLNYGSYASHVCFGPPQTPSASRAKFRCKLCRKQDLSTFLDFQAHVRRTHNACEMCFKNETDQETLYKHCQSHSLELMCVKCFLTYDNRAQFRKHLHFKHGEEVKDCRKCRQRTWPHVYHFCVKQTELDCEVCDRHFDGLKPYRVHMRTHTGDQPYLCNAKGCQQAYISRQLLWKHQVRRHPELKANAARALEEKRNKRLVHKFNASGLESILTVRSVIDELMARVIPEPEPEPEPETKDDNGSDTQTASAVEDQKTNEDKDEDESQEEQEYDPIDAAVRSIMGPEGSFDIKRSPTKSPARFGGGILSPPAAPAASPKIAPVTPNRMMRQPPPVPLPPSAANFASAISGGGDDMEPPQLVVRSAHPNARPVSIPQGQILPAGARVPGGIPVVRVGHVQPQSPSSSIPPPQRGANVRLPVMPGVGQGSPVGRPSPQREKRGNANNSDADDSDSDAEEGKATPPSQRTVSSMWNQDLLGIMPQATPNGPARKTIKTLPARAWDVMLSESSSESDGEGGPKAPKKPKIVERLTDRKLSLKDHDYCHAAFVAAQPVEDLSEMGKILSDVALGAAEPTYKSPTEVKSKKNKKKKKKKKKKKRKHRNKEGDNGSSSSNSDAEIDVTDGAPTPRASLSKSAGPKPKYHAGGAAKGVTAQTARPPRFSSSSEDEDEPKEEESTGEIASSDLDTDFEAEGLLVNLKQIQTQARRIKPTAKVVEAEENRLKMKEQNGVGGDEEGDDDVFEAANGGADDGDFSDGSGDISGERSDSDEDVTVSKYHQQRMGKSGGGGNRLVRPPPLPPQQKPLKLKIKLPPKPGSSQPSTPTVPLTSSGRPRMINTSLSGKTAAKSAAAAKSRVALASSAKPPTKIQHPQIVNTSPGKKRPLDSDASKSHQHLSKKMRESLALNRPAPDSDSDSDSDVGEEDDEGDGYPHRLQVVTQQEVAASTSLDESVDSKLYCVCQCPHDDVSEMIGCDAPDCRLEWFHFECVGILVPPEGKWYCPECSKRYKVRNR